MRTQTKLKYIIEYFTGISAQQYENEISPPDFAIFRSDLPCHTVIFIQI